MGRASTTGYNFRLSFVYQASQLAEPAGTFFAVEVQDGQTVTSIFNTAANASNWTHRWLDLSPWAGKEITLRFLVHLIQGATVLLDDVTIGPAQAELWVGEAGPGARCQAAASPWG